MTEPTTKPSIRVVAAEISNDQGEYLITQRLPHASMPLLWEFPGGKVEVGESDAAALQREIQEELEISIDVGEQSVQALQDYPTYSIDFHSFSAKIVSGQPQRIGVWDFRWVKAGDLAKYRFPPADQATIDRLIAK